MNVVKKEEIRVREEFSSLLNLRGNTKVDNLIMLKSDNSQNEISSRLIDYRTRIYKTTAVEAFEIFTNHQMALIIRNMPKNETDLKKCCLSDAQISRYGNGILGIVKECCNLVGFEIKTDR